MNESAVVCVELANRRAVYQLAGGGWTVEDFAGHTLAGGRWQTHYTSHRDRTTVTADVFATLDEAVTAALGD